MKERRVEYTYWPSEVAMGDETFISSSSQFGPRMMASIRYRLRVDDRHEREALMPETTNKTTSLCLRVG
jgi:hypothetical protein